MSSSLDNILAPGVTLRQEQTRAIAFARDRSAVGLSMPMGSGKTLTAAILAKLWSPSSILIVAPDKISRDPKIWRRHLTTSSFLRQPFEDYTVLSGLPAKKRAELYDPRRVGCPVFIINCDSVWREPLASKLLRYPPELLLIDESHRAKKPGGTLSRFLYKLARLCKHKIAGTGTMLAHSPLDAWMQTRILDTNLLPAAFSRFRERYAVMGGYMGKEVLSGRDGVPWINQEELGALLSNVWFTCEVKYDEIIQVDETRSYTMSPKTQRIYDDLENELVADFVADSVVGRTSSPLTITRTVRTMQALSGFMRTDDMPGAPGRNEVIDYDRRDLFAEVLEEIDQQERVVAFVGNFAHDLAQIAFAARAAGRDYFEISGSRSEFEPWAARPGAVLGVHIRSGAEGLDLTASRYGIFYSHQRSLAAYQQARSRLARPPANGRVLFLHLVAEGSLDDVAMSSLKERKDVTDVIYAAIRARLQAREGRG